LHSEFLSLTRREQNGRALTAAPSCSSDRE
jgi:hypothetical protein